MAFLSCIEAILKHTQFVSLEGYLEHEGRKVKWSDKESGLTLQKGCASSPRNNVPSRRTKGVNVTRARNELAWIWEIGIADLTKSFVLERQILRIS